MKFLLSSVLAAFAAIRPCAAIEIIAHRGSSEQAPENTVAAFSLAWEKGTDACELDMHLTSDQKIVIIHDKDTKRTTGIVQDVSKGPLKDLRALDAGSWKGTQWAGEKLPTLEEALATMPPGNKRFFLEIKCGPEIVPELTRSLEPMRDRAVQLAIISFNRAAAAAAKKAMPSIKAYLLVAGKTKDKKPRRDVAPFIEQAKADGLDGLDLGSDWPWSPNMVRQIRDAGLGVYVWTVDQPEDVARFARLGVDGITTNNPVRAREALANQ